MSKTLITGGAGFIGSNLAQELVRKGEEVVILNLNMYLTTGGKERSMDEWTALFEITGWTVYWIKEFNGHHIFKLRKENE